MERKMKVLLITLAVMAAAVVTASAQKEATIKGEVIDVSCYTAEGAKGAEHQSCALACIQGGEPAGILEEGTGKVYVVVTGDHTNPATKVLPFVAQMVEVKGTVHEKSGLRSIDIKEIKALEKSAMEAPKEGKK